MKTHARTGGLFVPRRNPSPMCFFTPGHPCAVTHAAMPDHGQAPIVCILFWISGSALNLQLLRCGLTSSAAFMHSSPISFDWAPGAAPAYGTCLKAMRKLPDVVCLRESSGLV